MQTEAQKRAKKKYADKTYKNYGIKIKIADAEILDTYINNKNINSRNSYIINCIKYCINNNINVFDDQNTNNSKDSDSQNTDLDNERE